MIRVPTPVRRPPELEHWSSLRYSKAEALTQFVVGKEGIIIKHNAPGNDLPRKRKLNK